MLVQGADPERVAQFAAHAAEAVATARGGAARVHAQALDEVRSQQAVAQQVTRQAEAAISTAQEQARQAVQGTMDQARREMSARDSAANLEIMSLREREAELQARLGEAQQEISQLRQAMSESQVRVATLEAGNGTDTVVGMMQSTLASFEERLRDLENTVWSWGSYPEAAEQGELSPSVPIEDKPTSGSPLRYRLGTESDEDNPAQLLEDKCLCQKELMQFKVPALPESAGRTGRGETLSSLLSWP